LYAYSTQAAGILLIKKESTVEEVDRDLLESLVERIDVGEKEVLDGVKTQDVGIFYRYVGAL